MGVNKASEWRAAPLYVAAPPKKGYLAIVQYLVEWQAKVNQACNHGYTPL